jgi:hypothetical protein
MSFIIASVETPVNCNLHTFNSLVCTRSQRHRSPTKCLMSLYPGSEHCPKQWYLPGSVYCIQSSVPRYLIRTFSSLRRLLAVHRRPLGPWFASFTHPLASYLYQTQGWLLCNKFPESYIPCIIGVAAFCTFITALGAYLFTSDSQWTYGACKGTWDWIPVPGIFYPFHSFPSLFLFALLYLCFLSYFSLLYKSQFQLA